MKLFNRGHLNAQQFEGQLRMFNPGPATEHEPDLGPPTGRTPWGARYWKVGESQPGSHPGQGRLFRNDTLRGHWRYGDE